MRLPIVFVLVFACATTRLIAQQNRIDSLVAVADDLVNDGERAQLLHRAVALSWDYDLERAHTYALEEYKYAAKTNDPEWITIALTDIGMYSYFTGDYKTAASYYAQAIEAAGSNNFGEYPAYTLTRIGNLFRVQGEYDSAKYYYKQTEALLKKTPAGVALASLYFHYGWMYEELSEFKKSLSYLYRARDIRYKIGDSLLIAECWRVMGEAHLGLNRGDSAEFYFNKTANLARRYSDTELQIFTSINLGDVYSARGQSVEAIRAYESALNSLGKHDFKRNKALVLFHVGIVFYNRSDNSKALEYYFNALKINEELNSQHEIARIQAWIGWAYSNLRNYARAEEYALKSLAYMRRAGDKGGKAFAHNLLGNILTDRKEFEAALAHYDSALTLRKSLELNLQISNTLFNTARVYQAQKRYDEALKYYFEDLDFARSIGNTHIIATLYTHIGMVYTYKKEFKKSEKFLLDSHKLLKNNDLMIERRDNYLALARMYRLSGRSEKAGPFYERYIEISDSIINRDNSRAAVQRDALYQLDKMERKIESLNAQNKIKGIEIDTHKARIRFQNAMIVLSVFALLLISLVTYILYRYYKSKSLANTELSKLNREIREQKEEIQAQSEELIEASHTIQEINRGLESAVEERTMQLKQAYQELDMFIYRSSHDFRRPLTTFMGLAEVAKISVKDVTAMELFTKVSETAHNLDRMLGKLQAVSQIASSDLMLREIDFNSELDFVLDLQRVAIIEKRIRVERRIDSHQAFVSYPVIIRIILENLLENAVQFSRPPSPFIKISIEQELGVIKIKVEDNGEGVAEEFHNRLFEMYFRANERSKGNGLGLYLVKKAVEKLEGRIEFKAVAGEGSSFIVFLPYFEK